eukprot:360290-Chlamydomonas_euryale.AAC.2
MRGCREYLDCHQTGACSGGFDLPCKPCSAFQSTPLEPLEHLKLGRVIPRRNASARHAGVPRRRAVACVPSPSRSRFVGAEDSPGLRPEEWTRTRVWLHTRAWTARERNRSSFVICQTTKRLCQGTLQSSRGHVAMTCFVCWMPDSAFAFAL